MNQIVQTTAKTARALRKTFAQCPYSIINWVPLGGRYKVDFLVHAGAWKRWQVTAYVEVCDIGGNRFLLRGGDLRTDRPTVWVADVPQFGRLLHDFDYRVRLELGDKE